MNTKCCFVGHRKIEKKEELEEKLYREIEQLILVGVDTFLFGSKSEFNRLCYHAVSNLKEKYPQIKRVYVRAEFPDVSQDYTDYLLEGYEETYYPDEIRRSGRGAYVERNQSMINESAYCIAYYKEGYLPPRRKNARRDLLGLSTQKRNKTCV